MTTLAIAAPPAVCGSSRQPVLRSELDRFFAGINSRMEPAAKNSTDDSSCLQVSNFELEQFFAAVSSRIKATEKEFARGSSRLLTTQSEFERFFAAVSHRVELAETQQRRRDKKRATGFNVFDLIEPDENKLSDVLAGLLDPEGCHGQGDLFLRLLFKQLGLGSDPKLTKNVTVLREAPTHGILKYRRRIDVLVEAGAWVAIENKVDSLEQQDQVKDYLEHLRYCTKHNIQDSVLIYLTPNERKPDSLSPAAFEEAQRSRKLRCWSYHGDLRVWLESCRHECEAQKIRDFISDFIAYIESSLKQESENNQQEESDEN